MPIGPIIRQMLGPFERSASELYRSVFVNLNAFADQIKQWTSASNILELGCGEGAVAERLVDRFPNVNYTGIDITPRVGRLFTGNPANVIFTQQAIKEFAPKNIQSFDLLVMCDIMHHIPWELHNEILIDAKKVLKPGGYLVLKDWERNLSPIHLLCYISDRFVTGDHVRYKSADELQKLIEEIFGKNSIKARTRIRPWANNVAFLVQI